MEAADAPLLDCTPPPPRTSPPTDEQPSSLPALTTDAISSETTGPASLFQSLDSDASDSAESSDSDENLDLNRVNEDWAKLKLELETLRAVSGASKGKGKKNKGSLAMETPEMHKVRGKMTKLEKDYMFSRKDAGAWPLFFFADIQMLCLKC